MNKGPDGLPRWVLNELAQGGLPEVSAQLATVVWERNVLKGTIGYLFHVGGQKHAVVWLRKNGPEPA